MMIVNLHMGCGGQITSGLCSECDQQPPPDRVFAFEDPLLSCKKCKLDEKIK